MWISDRYLLENIYVSFEKLNYYVCKLILKTTFGENRKVVSLKLYALLLGGGPVFNSVFYYGKNSEFSKRATVFYSRYACSRYVTASSYSRYMSKS